MYVCTDSDSFPENVIMSNFIIVLTETTHHRLIINIDNQLIGFCNVNMPVKFTISTVNFGLLLKEMTITQRSNETLSSKCYQFN